MESKGCGLKLLSLSANDKEMTGNNSGHFVIIDRPDEALERPPADSQTMMLPRR